MRILVTMQPSAAHANLYLPTLRACAAEGHDVLVAVSAVFADRIERAGLPTVAAGLDWTDSEGMADRWPDWADVPPERAPMFFVGTICAERLAPPMVDSLGPIIESFEPDLLVRDMTEFGAVVAAERYDLPHASIGFGPSPGPARHLPLVDEPLKSLRADPTSPLDLHGQGALHVAATSFVADPSAIVDGIHLVRPDVFDGTAAASAALGPMSTADGRPLVYASLGTVFSTPELFQILLDGLAELPIEVIGTTGRFDPSELDVPANARVERYLPNSELVPLVDLVIAHGGYTTLMGLLSAGKPMVLVPQGADQPRNAARAVEMGVARVIEPEAFSADTVRDAVSHALDDPSLGAAARTAADEISEMPGPDEAAALLASFGR